MLDYSEKFEKMRVAGKLAAETLDMLTGNIKPGVTTEFIDKLGYEFIRDNGAGYEKARISGKLCRLTCGFRWNTRRYRTP